ncbi:MAG: glycoside hydrolase family 3 C-terminal domain-containing protein [Bacteroidales bacterium]
MRNNVLALIFFLITFTLCAQPYKDPGVPVEERVKDLLGRMTPEEKFRQLFMIPGDIGGDTALYQTGLFGFQVNTVGQDAGAAGQMLNYAAGSNAFETAVKINELQHFFSEETRLGIPIIPFDEALHGLVRSGATAFPQAIGLAATWNPELMRRVAEAIAMECKTRGIRQVLSPVVNIASDVRWGRTEETYGEDPYLASLMGKAYISAFEKNSIITTPKHFVANVGEGGRDSYPIHWNDRYMREYIFPPFEACIRKGGARSVMTAYNSYDGTPCTASDYLLNKLLREEWGFEGFVISDAGGTGGANVLHFTAADYADATTKSLTSGLDVIFQTSIDHQALFLPPFLDGSIPQETIDTAVARVLRQKFLLGLFEDPYVDPKLAAETNGNIDHRTLARQAARESIVLLKNENGTLPVSPQVRSILVTGPDADEARLGGYSGPGNIPVSILQGIRATGKQVDVVYTRGCDRTETPFLTVPEEFLSCIFMGEKVGGLKGEYYNNVTFTGEPALVRVDKQVKFQWTLYSPEPEKLTYDFYSVRWTGKITAPETGGFRIGIDGNDGYRLYIDGKLIADKWIKRTREAYLVPFSFRKGQEYDIRIEFYEPVGNAWFSLVWDFGLKKDQDAEMDKAVGMAARSDMAIVVVGIEEGEFLDRASLDLPGRQEELIRRIASTGTPTVVVIVGGSAVTMQQWIDDADAILAVWYPGEEGGNALAELLFGDFNPSGRLPITYPVSVGQLPLSYNHKPTGRGDDYSDLTGQPLFPFGFGLSYSTFTYGIELKDNIIPKNGSTQVIVYVTNTSERGGSEVVQLYIRDELASVARPVTALKSFAKVTLRPFETKGIIFEITPDRLSMLNKEMEWVVEPGDFRIMVGASSKDIRQRVILTVTD